LGQCSQLINNNKCTGKKKPSKIRLVSVRVLYNMGRNGHRKVLFYEKADAKQDKFIRGIGQRKYIIKEGNRGI
jgi:hypothetical protein